MISLFTIPKPFRGHSGVIQRNAIHSWSLLRPACEIILFGSEDGTAEVAAEFGMRHVPDVLCNQYGTPLLNSVFDKVHEAARNDLLCYVNADIILMNDFVRAVRRVRRWSFLFPRRRFLLAGQRWNVEIREPWDFANPIWEVQLREYVNEYGTLYRKGAIDYFVFTRGLFGEIPPFAIGRTAWDNWLIYRARCLDAPVVFATNAIMCVHQNHDYAHNAQGKMGIFEGPEAKLNQELAGGSEHYYTLWDSTWTLTSNWLRPAWGKVSRQQRGKRKQNLLREQLSS